MSIEFLYNRSFDDFDFSEQFYKEYEKEFGKYDFKTNWEVRFNPNVLYIVKKIGLKNAQGKYSRLAIKEYPIELEEYINIHEYDGCEKPYIQWEKYLRDKFLNIDLNNVSVEYIINIQNNLKWILALE
jgi:hypothetical protein